MKVVRQTHKKWRASFRQRYQQWIYRRLPPNSKIRLVNRRLFIFPTRAGLGFGALLAVLWLVATNFENNLVFASVFLLSAMFVVTIFHTFLNLLGLSVEVRRAHPCFCGGRAEFEVLISQTGRRHREAIFLHYPASEVVSCSLPGTELVQVSLFVETDTRGWFLPGRITISSVYPLGLLRVWTYLDLNERALVYPRPYDARARVSTVSSGEGENEAAGGREDFRGLEKYKVGESFSHIAWKHYAREQGLQTKQYSDPVEERIWIDWDAFAGLDAEARLSRMCGWLVAISTGTRLYGLRLPGIEIPPSTGDVHRSQLLRELALFEPGLRQ